MPVGDMFIVLAHETQTRYDKKEQTVTTKTNYFVPVVKNTRDEAMAFADKVKGCYHTDVIQVWNPRTERTCNPFIRQRQPCSNCGALVSLDAATDCIATLPVLYCPWCGAKVVEQ